MEPLVTMTGRVGQMPDLRTTKGGVSYTRFRLAHTPRLLRDGAWIDGETSWVTVLCYRDLAHNVCTSLSKGDPVVVTGRFRVETWIDDNTKGTRETATLDARAVGHDLGLGTSRFTRVRHEKPENREEHPEVDGDSEANGDDTTAAAPTVRDSSTVPDSPADLLEATPF